MLAFGTPHLLLVVAEGTIALIFPIMNAVEGAAHARVMTETLGNEIVAEEKGKDVEESDTEEMLLVTPFFPLNGTTGSKVREVVEEGVVTEGGRNFEVVFLRCCPFCSQEIGVIAHRVA